MTMEDEEKVDGETLGTEGEGETPEETPTVEVDIEELQKKASAYEAQKIRAEKAEKALKKYSMKPQEQGSSVDSVSLIKLGKKLQDYSNEELDFVVGYAKSQKPEDILKALENPFIQAGVKAQREKVEKENLTLKPNGTQTETDKPKSLAEQIKSADMTEKEAMLTKLGLYRDPTPANRYKVKLG